MTSTLVLRLGRAHRERQQPAGGKLPGIRFTRRRDVTAEFAVERLDGTVATDVAGASDPALCGALDACGLAGTLTLTPAVTGGEAYLEAEGPARVGSHALRVALGLASGRAARGVRSLGGGTVKGRSGSVAAALSREGGGCADTAPVTEGAIQLAVSGGRLVAGYLAGGAAEALDPLRTR